MTKKRESKKPRVVWVGSTPITPFTAKEHREIDKHIKKHQEQLRKSIPEFTARSWSADLQVSISAKRSNIGRSTATTWREEKN
jgi:hypothetical protein